MAAITTFINALLNAGFGGGTYTGATIRIALFSTGLPSGSGVEVTGGSYARQVLSFSAAATKRISTSANATFTNLPTSQNIVAYGIYNNTTLIDEKLLDTPFQADVNTNTLTVSYYFDLSGS